MRVGKSIDSPRPQVKAALSKVRDTAPHVRQSTNPATAGKRPLIAEQKQPKASPPQASRAVELPQATREAFGSSLVLAELIQNTIDEGGRLLFAKAFAISMASL